MKGRQANADTHPDMLRRWLEATLASVSDAVIATDVDGRIEFLNPAAEAFLCIEGTATLGQSLDGFLQIIDAENKVSVESPLRQAIRLGRQVMLGKGMAVRMSGKQLRLVEASVSPVRSPDGSLCGSVVVLRDASSTERESIIHKAYAELDRRAGERRQALERAVSVLRESSVLLETFAASTPELIFVKDRDSRILMVNPAALQALGLRREEVIGRDDIVLFGNPDESQHIRENDRQIIEHGEAITVEQKQLTTTGMRTYLVTKSPLRDDEGGVIGIVGVATDITERNRAQRELEYLLVAEHRMRGEAERASRAKDEFLAVVSHELRSPLNALTGWSHVLSSMTSPDPLLVMRGTQAIKRNVAHQARLIDDLLDTSRIISGKLEIEHRIVNFVDVVYAALELSRDSAKAKRIDLRFTPEQPVLTVVGDPGRLQQVIINLLSNAIKFTPEKGQVNIALYRQGNRIKLSVADTGIGIDPDFLPHVFNRFSQADSSTIRRYRGLGIGLALVRYLVELHGGTASAASPGSGHGATFTIELPAHSGGVSSVSDESERRLRPGGDALRGIQVLLVDDEPDARDVIEIALIHAGGQVQTFESGHELLTALREKRPRAMPTVLLLDIAMPDENGFDLLAGVRALNDTPFIPAIAVTALTHLDREQFTAAGFQESIGKPIDINRLIETIVTLANRKGSDAVSEQAYGL